MLIQRLQDVLHGLLELNRTVEETFVDVLAAFTPWLAPIIPAFLAWRNMTVALHFPAWIAAIGALVVEFLGVSTVHTTFMLWDYNETKRKDDQTAPVQVSAGTAAAYLAIVLTTNVLLGGRRPIEQVAQALLSLLSVIGALTLAIRSQHARRLAAIASDRAERRKARKLSGTPSAEVPAVKLAAGKPPAGRREAGDWRELSPEERRQFAEMTAKQITALYPVSERTARAWREKVRKNGYGNA